MGIKNVRVENITAVSAELAWETTVPASTVVDVGPVVNGTWEVGRRDSAEADSLDHRMVLDGLSSTTLYRAAAVSFDGTDTFNFLPVDDGSSPKEFTTLQAGGGTVVGPPPTVSTPTADSVTIAWTTAEAGVGMVTYRPDGGVDMQAYDVNDAPALDHQVVLEDLVGGTRYSCHYETDLEGSDVTVVSEEFSFDTQPSASVEAPGHVAICSQPVRVKVGRASTIKVQVLKRDGTPQAGIPIAFSLGAGRAEGTLSATSGSTNARGICKVSFTVTAIPAARRKARRFVVALVGQAGGNQKRRRTVVVGLK